MKLSKRKEKPPKGRPLTRITSAVLKDENSVLPVSPFIDNYYDVGDLMSIPAVVNKKGVRAY